MTEDKQQPQSHDNGQQDNTIGQLDGYLPVDEFVEEVSVDGKTIKRKGIYLLPNLFTTAALFSGFYAVVSSMQGRFEEATLAILVAMVLDILDGRVARLTNTQSAFGAEYDSLSDMVSFGVAPALVMFNWSLASLGKFGWAVCFIYVAGAAVRLARFNTMTESSDKNYFTGVASPAAAASIACAVWLCLDLGYEVGNLPDWLDILLAIMTAANGFLMVSNFKYISFKGVDFKNRVPMTVLIITILIFSIVLISPSTVLLSLLVLYIASGPFVTWRYKRKQ